MTDRHDLDTRLDRWFESEATGRAPDRMFEHVFVTTARTPQARAWPRWLSRPDAPRGRRLLLLVAAALVALALASGALITGAERLFNLAPPAPPSVRAVGAATVASACPHADAMTPVGSAVWIHCPDQVRRLGAVTGGVTGVLPALAFAADDRDVWIATDRAVNVLDPSSLASLSSLPVAGATAIALDADSAWIAVRADHQIIRIDRASLTTAATISLPDEPGAVAAGGGSIWVTIPGSSRVLRIDPATNEISASMAVPSSSAISFAGGRVWVLDSSASALTRIDPITNTTQVWRFVPKPAGPGAAAALPPGSSSPPGGFAMVGTSLWEVAGSDAVETDAASGAVLQTIHVVDPVDVALTAIAGVNGQLFLVDGRGGQVLALSP
jgi:DNA-binding beta-propeller fold protein YncE